MTRVNISRTPDPFSMPRKKITFNKQESGEELITRKELQESLPDTIPDGLASVPEMESLNYKRHLDIPKSLLMLERNFPTELYGKRELNSDKVEIFDSIFCLLGNLFFLSRLAIYQTFLVALAHSPLILTLLLVLVEFSFLFGTLYTYIKLKHFKYMVTLFSKVS